MPLLSKSIALTALLLPVSILWTPKQSLAEAPMDRVTAYVSNDSVFDHTYTFRMVGCRPGCCYQQTWTLRLPAHKNHDLGLCSNKALSDGYGEFYYHDEQTSQWTHKPQIRDKDKVALY